MKFNNHGMDNNHGMELEYVVPQMLYEKFLIVC